MGNIAYLGLPSGKQNDGKSQFFMEKITINGDFPSFFVCLPQRVPVAADLYG